MASVPKTLCILFADVSGSTTLYERLGDAEALHAVERCINRMKRVTEGHKGRVVKTIGDEVMAVFPAADMALQAACDMQQRIDDLPPISGIKMAVRIGFHYGPALEEDGDVYGDSVNIAARLAGLAKASQIITSGETVATLPPLLQQSTRDLDALSVKGKSADIRVFEVLWQETTDLTMKAPSLVAPRPQSARLTVNFQGMEVVIDASRGRITLGRDISNDLVVKDQRASRTHARIEYRRDKFVLVDQSTNGTFLRVEGETEVVLKREESILRSRGTIGFGHSAMEQESQLLRFEVAD
ncbi:MAG: adenylate/guanylate cyclase domain-containing protein [Rhodocyclaceae bacterium]|nr:adenylate/guanylate cyclase domain-containing protein [Rhodocyclaceae bacterium]